MLTPLPTLTTQKQLQTLSRRTLLLSACGLSASFFAIHTTQDPLKNSFGQSVSWRLWVNSRYLPASVDDLIAKLQINPGGFGFNYASVEGEVAQAQKMNEFKRQYALQLEQVQFRTWQEAHKALIRAQVDLIFVPEHLTKMFRS